MLRKECFIKKPCLELAFKTVQRRWVLYSGRQYVPSSRSSNGEGAATIGLEVKKQAYGVSSDLKSGEFWQDSKALAGYKYKEVLVHEGL